MEKLIEIKKAKKVIFVGDTHGDLEASKIVIENFLKPENKIVFLGDYVDRGPFSKENLDFLLKMREKYPKNIILLQGNHEGHHILKFSPADFWESLTEKEYKKYCQIVKNFPLVVIAKKIIALHAALPDVKSLKEINEIKLGSKEWIQVCWGDFVEKNGKDMGFDFFAGRPQFGRDYFFELMERFKKKVLVRSHQPYVPKFMFNDRCLTIFTSCAYKREREIAILDFEKNVQTAKDLKIIRI